VGIKFCVYNTVKLTLQMKDYLFVLSDVKHYDLFRDLSHDLLIVFAVLWDQSG
jgi:hypothetical protein